MVHMWTPYLITIDTRFQELATSKIQIVRLFSIVNERLVTRNMMPGRCVMLHDSEITLTSVGRTADELRLDSF